MNQDRVAAYQGLGSDVRLGILRELLKGDSGVAELSAAVGVQPVTVRYHLQVLIGEGLVERLRSRREGDVGRPPIRYRLRAGSLVQGFPPRQYGMLAEVLLGILEGTLDSTQREEALEAAGREVGRRLVDRTEQDESVPTWTPEAFVRHYLDRVLVGMGLLTVVVDQTEDTVQYRALNCPFQEMAVAHPEMICDHLDEGFHKGVAKGLGAGVRHERLACIGHGDPYCEYRVRWPKKKE